MLCCAPFPLICDPGLKSPSLSMKIHLFQDDLDEVIKNGILEMYFLPLCDLMSLGYGSEAVKWVKLDFLDMHVRSVCMYIGCTDL